MALTDNLISFWELEEASGATRNDSHGTNHLTNTTAGGGSEVLQGTGKVGNCANLEQGTTDLFTRADNASLSAAGTDFTWCAWVNFESKPVTLAGIISKAGGSAAVMEYDVRWDAASDRFMLYVGGGIGYENVVANNFGAPALSTWYFVVAWVDTVGNTLNIQVNNGTADSASFSDTIPDTTVQLQIGGAGVGPLYTWDGLIDQVGFWKRVLTSDERAFLYNAGAGRSYAAIVAGEGGGGNPFITQNEAIVI
jgi:hypothetical protein